MADVLDMQNQESEPTPGEEKWSSISLFRCRKSIVSGFSCNQV